jgi:hypothetical protein
VSPVPPVTRLQTRSTLDDRRGVFLPSLQEVNCARVVRQIRVFNIESFWRTHNFQEFSSFSQYFVKFCKLRPTLGPEFLRTSLVAQTEVPYRTVVNQSTKNLPSIYSSRLIQTVRYGEDSGIVQPRESNFYMSSGRVEVSGILRRIPGPAQTPSKRRIFAFAFLVSSSLPAVQV